MSNAPHHRAGLARILHPALVVWLALVSSAANAVSLQVAPLLVEVPAPGAAATLTLRNEGSRPINAQMRLFRWTQKNGEDVLEATDEVAASPPIAALKSHGDYLVRIIRAGRGTVAKEEAYRLLVDELPDAARQQGGMVSMVLRQSVPVFFTPEAPEPQRLRWSARVQGGRLQITLANDGGRRVRVSRLRAEGATNVSFGEGLVGYALAGSSATWSRPLPHGLGATVTISAQGDLGPLHAVVPVQGR